MQILALMESMGFDSMIFVSFFFCSGFPTTDKKKSENYMFW